jgi:hypothetical protein
MKYTCEITINLPREEVIEKFDNAENMKHWQKGLLNYKNLSGTPGEEGAKMRLDYKMGKRSLSMVETITKRDLPREFNANYDTKGVHNIQRNYFHEVDSQSTKWTSGSEFQFSSFGMKLMGWLMPAAFKKQSLKYQEDFKNFAENGVSVLEKQ